MSASAAFAIFATNCWTSFVNGDGFRLQQTIVFFHRSNSGCVGWLCCCVMRCDFPICSFFMLAQPELPEQQWSVDEVEREIARRLTSLQQQEPMREEGKVIVILR